MPVRFTPIRQPVKQSGVRFTPLEDVEAGFFGKIAESFGRGQEQYLSHIGVYHALENPEEDLQGALIVNKKFRRKEILDPIEANWLSDIVYKSSRTTGTMWEFTKRAGVGAVIGAGVGGAAGAAIGAVIPTIGEEPVTVAAGAKIGAKLGAAEAAALFSYREGVGGMYADMIEQEVNPEKAELVAKIAGIPYALIEVAQLKAASPSVKAGLKKLLQKKATFILGKAAKKYGKTLTTEVLEETAQEVVQIAAEDTAKYLSGHDIHIDPEYLKQRASRVLNVTKEAAKGFALVPLPGTVIETGLGVVANETMTEIDQAKAAVDAPELTPEDVTSPTNKFRIALDNSAETYRAQSRVRTKELAEKFEKAEERKFEKEGKEYWRAKVFHSFKGEMSKLGIEPLKETLPMEVFNQMSQELRTTDKLSPIEAANLDEGIEQLFTEGKILPPHLIKYAKSMWGTNVAQSLEQIAEVAKGKKEGLVDYLALPKATSASIDLSRTLRQNALMVGKPKLWLKAFATDANLLIKDEKTARILEKNAQIKLDKMGDLVNKTGIRVNKWGEGADYRTGTEKFATRIAGKIPGIARSERAYAVGGNLLRMNYLKQIAQNRAGMVTTDKQWQDIGKILNIITGEGDPKTFGRYAPALNAILFAPRLLEARVKAFTELFNPRLSWAARRMLAYHVATFVGTNLGILGMMSMVPGVNVETDYRSTDFGKIRVGNTRFDFWAGYLPLARLITRLINKEIKTAGGRIMPAETTDTLLSFLQSKLGPAPALMLDIMRGQTSYGDYVSLDANSLTEQFYHRFIPFFLQDLADAVKYQGWEMGAISAPFAFLGAGVQTYPQGKSTEVLSYKNNISQEVLGRRWDELGPEVQDYMRDNFPEIEIKERQAAFDRTNFDFLAKIAKQKSQSQRRLYKALPADVRDEFDNLNLKPSGCSRTISTDWYLNEKRFKQYELNTLAAYKKIFPKLVRSPMWKQIQPELKVEIIIELMNEIKKAVRENIMAKANVNDIQRIKR